MAAGSDGRLLDTLDNMDLELRLGDKHANKSVVKSGNQDKSTWLTGGVC